jgi:hypothetical protein
MAVGARVRCAVAGVAAVWLVAGCAQLPPLRSPQLEGLQRALRDSPRERVQAWDACRAATRDDPGLVQCMEAAGYRLIGGADLRAEDCQVDYDGAADDPPPAWCFERPPAAE